MSQSQENVENQPNKRVIGTLGSVAVVVGAMLGIGIFITPPLIAQSMSDPWWFFGIWIVGAIAALGGAVAFAELGAIFPKAGGDYVYQQEVFGGSWAFASGWTLFGAAFTGSIAAMAVPLCLYQLPILIEPLTEVFIGSGASIDWNGAALGTPFSTAQLVAVVIILALTAVNATGAGVSTIFQSIVTLVPVAVLGAMSVYIVSRGSTETVIAEAASVSGETLTIAALVAAYLPVYFAFSGWNAVVYVAGEVKDPSKNLPRALVGGTVLVSLLYLLMCGAYVTALGMPGLSQAGEAGTATAQTLGHPAATMLVALLITMALLGSLNSCILGGARLAYAMAKGGALPAWLAHLSGSGQSPVRALWLQALVACSLVLTGTFEQIIQLASIAMILTGSLTVIGVYVHRIKHPECPRPYRATGYPYLPAFYLLANLVVVFMMVSQVFTAQSLGDLFPVIGVCVMFFAYAVHRFLPHRKSVQLTGE